MYVMKTLRQSLALLLALLMLGGTMASCSEAPADTSGNTEPVSGGSAEAAEEPGAEAEAAPETEESILATLPSADFEGATVTALSRDDIWWQITTLAAEELNGETINDAIFNRNAAFMDSYNAELKVINDASGFTALVRNTVSAGDGAYDFVVPDLSSAAAMVNEDLIFNLNNIASLDFTNPAWDQNAVEYYSVANKLYYGVSDISLGKNEAAWIYMFNKRLLAEHGLEDPYTLVREGKWTFDKTLEFMAAATNDTNGNGVVDTGDRFGLATHDVNYYALLISAGQPMAIKDPATDLPVINGASEAFVTVYDKLKEYFTDTSQTVMEYQGETFTAGNALLCGQVIACVRLFREMEDDFGLVPSPKYDEAQESHYTYVIPYDVFASVIPVSAADPERSGTAIQALAIYSMEYLTPAYYDVTITGKGLRDQDSEEMLELILSSTVYDLARMYNWGSLASGIPADIHNKREFTSTFQSKSKSVDKLLARTVETVVNNKN